MPRKAGPYFAYSVSALAQRNDPGICHECGHCEFKLAFFPALSVIVGQ